MYNIKDDIIFNSDSFVVYKLRDSSTVSENEMVESIHIEIGGKGKNHTAENLCTNLENIDGILNAVYNPEKKNNEDDIYSCLHCMEKFDKNEEYFFINYSRYCFHKECFERLRENLQKFTKNEKELVVSHSI